jgi:hypothetical protein
VKTRISVIDNEGAWSCSYGEVSRFTLSPEIEASVPRCASWAVGVGTRSRGRNDRSFWHETLLAELKSRRWGLRGRVSNRSFGLELDWLAGQRDVHCESEIYGATWFYS